MLETRGLTRLFGDQRAVDDVNVTVRPGGLTGFVGGNGAGKTTTMRMIMGILEPTAGEVLWRGRPVAWEDRARFGYMPEERGLYPKQPVLFQLVYLGRLHGMTAAAARRAGRSTWNGSTSPTARTTPSSRSPWATSSASRSPRRSWRRRSR